MNTSALCEVDGSLGEGGGQILRNSISYALILRKEIKITNIRKGRSKPGLKAQHVTGLRLAADVCGGSLSGNTKDSQEIHFQPLQLPPNVVTAERSLTGDTKTAGSICLLLQAALPCALLGTRNVSRLVLCGGTNATLAPQYDYWERVFLPTIRDRCGLESEQVQALVVKRGYFPKGGGEVHVRVQPLLRPLRPIIMTDRGKIQTIRITAFHVGRLPRHLAVEMEMEARRYLEQHVEDEPAITSEVVTHRDAIGSALGILIIAETTTGCLLAGSALSTPKKKAREVAVEAAAEIVDTLKDGGCVDEWLQDQLIIFMALADGVSALLTGSLTLHTQTAIRIAEELSGAQFEITRIEKASSTREQGGDYGKDGRIPGKHMIRCHGVEVLNTK